jgi:hypothetical protein
MGPQGPGTGHSGPGTSGISLTLRYPWDLGTSDTLRHPWDLRDLLPLTAPGPGTSGTLGTPGL